MTLNQLSIFLENKPGQLLLPCEALAKARINIITLSLADTQQFGLLRLIVRDWVKAKDVLERAGCVVKVTEVVALEVEDTPGGLAETLRVIEGAEVNVEYMYAFPQKCQNRAMLVVRFSDPQAAIARLSGTAVRLLSTQSLESRFGT